MFLKRILSALGEIDGKLDILIAERMVLTPASEQSSTERVKFKLDDREMQEGISNLLGYDPFRKKRSGEE